MKMRLSVACLHTAVAVAMALGVSACASGTPPADDASKPPPALDDEEDGLAAAAPASSPKVKEGTDALQAQDFAKAKGLLEAAAQESPKDPQAAFYLGVAVEGLGDPKGAADHYRHALELDPKLTEASENLSGVLLDQGDAAGALAAAEAGLKTAPKSASLRRNRAVALDQAGSKDAVAAFKDAVEAAPNDKEVHYLYADAMARAGNEAGAIAELKPLVASDDVGVLASAGRLLGKLKAFDECIAALDKVISAKDVAELRVRRGVCKRGKKDDKGAEADFNAAIQADAKIAAAHYHLGQIKREHGDKKVAKVELTKAAELDPSGGIGVAAKKALAELK
jgi:Tfp pilus assembly protein PilF